MKTAMFVRECSELSCLFSGKQKDTGFAYELQATSSQLIPNAVFVRECFELSHFFSEKQKEAAFAYQL